jgi:hypothetical protein
LTQLNWFARFEGKEGLMLWPRVELLKNNRVALLEEYRCVHKIVPGIEVHIKIGEGTVTDGATINSVFWSLIGHPLESEFLEAALVHDEVCKYAKTANVRRFGDAMFNLLLERNKVSRWRRVVMFLVVRGYALFVWPIMRKFK